VVAAAAGLFGAGHLSHATAAVPGSLRIDYQRFSRYQTPEPLTAHVAPAATMAGEVRLAVDREYLDRFTLQSVVPPPLRVEGLTDRLVYVFKLAKPGEALKIVLLLQAERLGVSHGRVSLESARGAAPPIVVSFRQLADGPEARRRRSADHPEKASRSVWTRVRTDGLRVWCASCIVITSGGRQFFQQRC
jgi:hypothetical protein